MRSFLLLFWLLCLGTVTAFGDPLLPGETETVFSMDNEPNSSDGAVYEDNATAQHIEQAPQARYLYSSIVAKPERLFKGEIFELTLRTIVTTEAFETLQYRFDGGTGVELLTPEPERD